MISGDRSDVVSSVVRTGDISAKQFANLYLDLNSTVNNGSDLSFEMHANSVTALIPA